MPTTPATTAGTPLKVAAPSLPPLSSSPSFESEFLSSPFFSESLPSPPAAPEELLEGWLLEPDDDLLPPDDEDEGDPDDFEELLDDGLGWARSQGCTRILLEVRDDNTTAQQLYRSRGFDVLSRRPHYYRSTAGEPAADALIMAVSLTSPLLMPPVQHCSHTTRPARLPQQDGRPRQQVNDARRQPGCSETSHQAGQTGTNAHEENHV